MLVTIVNVIRVIINDVITITKIRSPIYPMEIKARSIITIYISVVAVWIIVV
jgi:hypothetical protein